MQGFFTTHYYVHSQTPTPILIQMNSYHIRFLSIQEAQHHSTLTIFSESVQLVNQFMHCPVFYEVKIQKMEHIVGT
jgi:hypothetical protein